MPVTVEETNKVEGSNEEQQELHPGGGKAATVAVADELPMMVLTFASANIVCQVKTSSIKPISGFSDISSATIDVNSAILQAAASEGRSAAFSAASQHRK